MIAITHNNNKKDKSILPARGKVNRGSLGSQKPRLSFKRTIWVVRGHSWIVHNTRVVNTMVMTGREILEDYHKPPIVAFRQGNTVVPRAEWETKGGGTRSSSNMDKLDSRYMITALYDMPPELETFKGILTDYYDNLVARFVWDARQIEYIQGVHKWEPRLSRHVRWELGKWVDKYLERMKLEKKSGFFW